MLMLISGKQIPIIIHFKINPTKTFLIPGKRRDHTRGNSKDAHRLLLPPSPPLAFCVCRYKVERKYLIRTC